jgi:hypothetical protein
MSASTERDHVLVEIGDGGMADERHLHRPQFTRGQQIEDQDSLLSSSLDYLWLRELLGGAAGAAGVIANVTHAVLPSARFSAAKSLWAFRFR